MIDFERLLQCLTVVYRTEQRKVYISLGIHEKGKFPAETVAFARYAMFGTAYWHHTSRACKAMLHRVVWEGLPERNQRTAYQAYRNDLVGYVLGMANQPGLFDRDDIRFPKHSQVQPTDYEMLQWLTSKTSHEGRRLVSMLIGRDLFRRILVVSKRSRRLWETLSAFRRDAGPEAMVEFQKDVQRRLIDWLRGPNREEMPHPHSTAVGAEAIDHLVAAHEEERILLLVDIPTQRTGSQTPLEYVPEADRRDILQEWIQPSTLEDSVIWKNSP